MITFIILAAALTFAAAIAIAIPLLKRDETESLQSPWTALAVIAVLVVGGAASYVTLSNWPWSSAPQIEAAAQGPDSPAAMVERLKARLAQNPQDLEGWLMLGSSYMRLDQVPLAIRAYEHADRIAGGKNPDVLVGLAEALAVQDQNALTGQAGELLEKALKINPKSGKALFYGGAAARLRGDLPLARQRFAALLDLNPPDNVKPLLQEQIANIDQEIAGGAFAGASSGAASSGADASSSSTQAAPPPSVAQNSTPNDSSVSSAGPAAVHVNVRVSPSLSANFPASAPLFVFVRDPNRPGPPLAVKRLSNRLPQAVELTSADAMVPGRELADGQQVQVVARIAKSGTPTAQSGDPFGEIGYHVGHDKVVDIVIDRLTP